VIKKEKEHMQAKDSESLNKSKTRETQMRNVTNDKKERFLITLTQREREKGLGVALAVVC
jgi:hypothetical protein